MPHRKDPQDKEEALRQALIKAEREIGENLPEQMVGEDTEDVGDLDRKGKKPLGVRALAEAE